jgi:hypothetical protein
MPWIWPGGSAVVESDVEVAFHGGWFRPSGRKAESLLDAPDVDDPFDRQLLTAWWLAGGRGGAGPGSATGPARRKGADDDGLTTGARR